MNHCQKLCSIGATLALFLIASPVLAVLLTFEEFPHADDLQGAGDSFLSRGYLFTYTPAPGEPYPVGFFAVGPSWQYNRASTAIMANSCSAVTKMVSNDAKPFNLTLSDSISIDRFRT